MSAFVRTRDNGMDHVNRDFRDRNNRNKSVVGIAQTPRSTGWRAHRARATVAELAYQLSVLPLGTDIWRELTVQKSLRSQSLLFYRSQGLVGDAYEAYVEKIRERVIRKTPRGNKFQRILHAERKTGIGKRTLDDIRLVARPAFDLHEAHFWAILSAQPTDYLLYKGLGSSGWFAMNSVYGTDPWTAANGVFVRPCEPVLTYLRHVNAWEGLLSYMLLFGAASDAGWSDIYEESFHRMIHIVCMMACVPPLDTFSDEFAMDVIGSVLGKERVAPEKNWARVVKGRISSYQQVIDVARDTGIIPRTKIFPTGNRNEIKELIKFVQEKGSTEVHMAITAHAHPAAFKKSVSDLIPELKARLAKADTQTAY